MISFKEYYDNKINEAAFNSFDDLIKQYGANFKNKVDAKEFARNVIKKAKEDFKDDFLKTVIDKPVSTKTDDYKEFALALDVLASRPTKTDKVILDKLDITPEGDDKIGDMPIIKNIRTGTKPYISSVTAAERVSTKAAAKAKKDGTSPAAEKPTDKPEETKTPETDKEDEITYKKPFEGKDTKALPSKEDDRSPSFIATQARDLLKAAIEKINTDSEIAPDIKKIKMKKAATNMEKLVNKKVYDIEKQEQGYSSHSNFSTRLKATTKSKKFLSDVRQIINKQSNLALSKSLDTRAEMAVKSVKGLGKAIKGGAEKVASTRAALRLKDVAVKAGKDIKAASKRGAELAKPIIKRTAEKVTSKIKTSTDDAIVKKWLPNEFRTYVNDETKQEEILKRAKDKRDKERIEADKRRRIIKSKLPPSKESIIKRKSEEPTQADVPKSTYPKQVNANLA